jgi:hemerythrin-like domain-containing protein
MSQATGHTFSALLSEHAELEQIFDRHQRALISKDIGAAAANIMMFESHLMQHITFEEDVILPLYKSKNAEVEGGNLPIFQAEHRKLREFAARLTRHTTALYSTTDILGSILKILEEEALFKGLFDHHALREQNLLFPRLDAMTTELERERVLEQHCA